MDKPTQQDYKIMSLEKSLRELLEMTREYHAEGTVSQRWFTEATYNAEAALKDPMSPLVPIHEKLIEEHEKLKFETKDSRIYLETWYDLPSQFSDPGWHQLISGELDELGAMIEAAKKQEQRWRIVKRFEDVVVAGEGHRDA